MTLIKRYPNRKLYDTEAKRYVTLDEIAGMVREGRDVSVVDHESGEDVSSLTLTQIILEQEKKSSGYLSSSLLTNLIRTGGNSVGNALDVWRRSVQHGVASLGGLNKASEEQINRLIEQGKLTVEQAQNLLRLDGLLDDVLHSLNLPTHRDIEVLQEQIRTLNSRLADLSADFSTEFPAEESAPAADSATEKTLPEDELLEETRHNGASRKSPKPAPKPRRS